jgi:hypothetical protein
VLATKPPPPEPEGGRGKEQPRSLGLPGCPRGATTATPPSRCTAVDRPPGTVAGPLRRAHTTSTAGSGHLAPCATAEGRRAQTLRRVLHACFPPAPPDPASWSRSRAGSRAQAPPTPPLARTTRGPPATHQAAADTGRATLWLGVQIVRNRTLTLIEREDDTRSWGNFLVYFSHSTTMSCPPRGWGYILIGY